MTETFCDSGAVKLRAGANAVSLTAAEYTQLINQAEDTINVAAKIPGYNLIDNYSSLNADVQKVLEMGTAALAAIGVISNDPSGFTTIGEAAFIANVNWTIYNEALKLIKEKQHTEWMQKQ